MSKIYMYTAMHLNRIVPSAKSPTFDPNLINQNDVSSLDGSRLNKPTYGLWSSPFNNTPQTYERNGETYICSENTWENMVMENHWSYVNDRKLYEEECKEKGLEISDDEMKNYTIYGDYSDEQIEQLKEKCLEKGIEMPKDEFDIARSVRNNAFYFALDQSKILHINSIEDIFPYVENLTSYKGFFGTSYKGDISFEAIRQAGYDGIEVHDAAGLHSHDIFYSWDVDSAVVWNPDCVIPVDREIAAIARIASGAYGEIDCFDHCMDCEYLIEWMVENKDKVLAATEAKIISYEDMSAVLEKRDEIREKREEIQQQIEDIRKQNIETRLNVENNISKVDVDANSIEYELAKYCCENNLHPLTLHNPYFVDREWEDIEMGDLKPGDCVIIGEGVIQDINNFLGKSPIKTDQEITIADIKPIEIDQKLEYVITTTDGCLLAPVDYHKFQHAYESIVQERAVDQHSDIEIDVNELFDNEEIDLEELCIDDKNCYQIELSDRNSEKDVGPNVQDNDGFEYAEIGDK